MAKNFFDRVVEAVDPERAVRRVAARRSLSIIDSGYGNHGASREKKALKGWLYHSGSSKEDVEDNITVLRQRSRDAYMGVPIATAAIKAMRTNVVAGGLMPTPQIDAALLRLSAEETENLQAQIVREWGLWADTSVCDADRIDNFYQLQQLAFLSYLMNGDALALLPMKRQSGQPYDLRVRVIEADRLCSPGMQDRLSPCVVNGWPVQKIVQGVETDADGMTVAYWICDRHPGSLLTYGVAGKMEWHRVEAWGEKSGRRNVLHVMQRERAGQVRGVPLLAPVLEALKQLGRYTDAEIEAALLSSMVTIFIEQEVAKDGNPFGEIIPPDKQVDAADRGSIEIAPGAIFDLAPGEKMNPFDPKHPVTSFEKFTEAVIKQVGAALEIPAEVLLKCFNSNYSAARGALNEFWRTCEMQRDWFASDFCQPIYEAWFSEAVARGRIHAPGYFNDPALRRAYTNCTWNGPARTSLNPKDEAEAANLRVQAGFSTAEQETAQMTGGIWTENMRQRKIEKQIEQEVCSVEGRQETVLAVPKSGE